MTSQPPHPLQPSDDLVREEIAVRVAQEIALWLAADPRTLAARIQAKASYDLAETDGVSAARNLRNDLLRRIATRLAEAA